MVQDKDDVDESLEEAFDKHNRGSYRPHMGPSGEDFEAYKEGGQGRPKPSFNVEQEYGTSQSLEDAYTPGVLGRIKNAVFGEDETEYVDLGEEVEGEHGVIDPSDYTVPQVQGWIDEQLEEGDTKGVERVLAQEKHGEQRKGVLTYVTDDDLHEFDHEEAEEMIQAFDPDNKSDLDPATP